MGLAYAEVLNASDQKAVVAALNHAADVLPGVVRAWKKPSAG
ncbi:MAG TPA: hypothetical protein VGS60_14045 [Actinomycetes bacterium]|nr:hypothetical protein [Actinomycetes bacterium]